MHRLNHLSKNSFFEEINQMELNYLHWGREDCLWCRLRRASTGFCKKIALKEHLGADLCTCSPPLGFGPIQTPSDLRISIRTEISVTANPNEKQKPRKERDLPLWTKLWRFSGANFSAIWVTRVCLRSAFWVLCSRACLPLCLCFLKLLMPKLEILRTDPNIYEFLCLLPFYFCESFFMYNKFRHFHYCHILLYSFPSVYYDCGTWVLLKHQHLSYDHNHHLFIEIVNAHHIHHLFNEICECTSTGTRIK